MADKPHALAPGVYGLVGKVVNVYVIDDPDSGVTVIDAGMPRSTGRILELVRAIGRTPQDVKHILVTHADVDHVGSLKPLADATGAAVYASAESNTYIQKRKNPPHVGMPMALFSGVINVLFRRAVPVNHIVTDGEVLDIAGGIRVLATPGHTPDQVSYFLERERVLFAGDLFNNYTELALTPRRITYDMAAAHRSARAVLALDPPIICCGHGAVWQAQDHPDRIAALLASLADSG